MNPRLRHAWPVAAVLIPAAIAAAFAGTDATLAWRDTARIMAPIRPLVVEAIRHGRLPLWNPYVGAGAPLFGDSIHGVLHPLSVVAAFAGDGVDLLIYLYLAAAALGAYVAARSFGVSREAAAAAAIGYGASGAVLGTASLVQCLAGAATLPWVIAAGRRAGVGGSFGVPLLAAATASMIFGGDIQGTVVSTAAAFAIAIEAGGRRGGGRATAGILLGVVIGAIQLWPTWAVMQRSLRVYDFDTRTLHQWALHPWRVLELFVPGLVGGSPGPARVAAFMVLEPEGRFTMPFLPSVFVGVPLLAAAAAGTASRTGKLLAVGAGLLLWLALGHWLGAQQALSWVPIWKSFRYAEKLVPHFAMIVALLAALGMDAIVAGCPERRRAVVATLLLTLAAAIGVEGYIRSVASRAEPAEEGLAAAATASAGLMGFALSALAMGSWLAVARRRPKYAAAAFAALVAAQAAASGRFALLATPRESLRHPPTLEARPPGPRLVTPRLFAIRDVHGPRALTEMQTLESEAGTANFNAATRVDNLDIAGALFSRRYEYLWTALGEDRWTDFRRFGASHVAVPQQLDAADRAMAAKAIEGGTLAAHTEAVRFYSVPHRPWAFFAEAVRAVPSQWATIAATRKAIREGLPGVVLETATAPPVAPGRILRVERRPERVTIDAEADGDGLLVVNDAYWPGWSATIDGAPAKIIPADVLVRAVPFPSGSHRLEMRYAPLEVGLGGATATAGLAGLLALVAVEWRRGRRKRLAGIIYTDE